MRHTQEKWATPGNCGNLHLKYHLQLKTKENVGNGSAMCILTEDTQ